MEGCGGPSRGPVCAPAGLIAAAAMAAIAPARISRRGLRRSHRPRIVMPGLNQDLSNVLSSGDGCAFARSIVRAQAQRSTIARTEVAMSEQLGNASRYWFTTGL